MHSETESYPKDNIPPQDQGERFQEYLKRINRLSGKEALSKDEKRFKTEFWKNPVIQFAKRREAVYAKMTPEDQIRSRDLLGIIIEGESTISDDFYLVAEDLKDALGNHPQEASELETLLQKYENKKE